jgi:hypothetical protein
MSKYSIPEAIRYTLCEQLASELVESMDMDDLIEYAVSNMEGFFSELNHNDLLESAEDHWGEELPKVLESMKNKC